MFVVPAHLLFIYFSCTEECSDRIKDTFKDLFMDFFWVIVGPSCAELTMESLLLNINGGLILIVVGKSYFSGRDYVI